MNQSDVMQTGFTAVELLITLLVASMFLLSGYQLYAVVQRDGAEANKAAMVSVAVSAKLRAVAAGTTACPNTDDPLPANEPGIGTVDYITTITCTAFPTMRLITVTASYGTPTKTLQQAMYDN